MAKANTVSEFTQSFESLEDILEQFRSGDLNLDDSLALFEKGIGHLN